MREILDESNSGTDAIVLSSGRKVSLPGGFLGINSTGTIGLGHDGVLRLVRFTPAELIEISEYAISMWQNFRYQQIERIKREKNTQLVP